MEMNRLATFSAILALVGSLFAFAPEASAQNASTAAACGTQSFPVGYAQAPIVMTQTGQLCVNSSSTPSAPAAVPATNASGTVTLGGTYQTVFAASTSRKGCMIQNPTTATEILSVRQAGTAVWTIPIGATLQCGGPSELIASDLFEITAATTGHAFTAVSQ
jgi:hypothetical protein